MNISYFNFSRTQYSYLLYSIFPKIFNDSGYYIYRVIENIYNAGGFAKIHRDLTYLQIFGFRYCTVNTNEFQSLYNKVYTEFINAGKVPLFLKEKALTLIRDRKPLSNILNTLNFAYCRNLTDAKIVNDSIKSCGEAEFILYLYEMIEQYRTMVYDLPSMISYRGIATYIYGEKSILHKSYTKYCSHREDLCEIYRLTYKVVFPFTYQHCKTYSARLLIYQLIDLSVTEIESMEKKRFDIANRIPTHKIYSSIDTNTLPMIKLSKNSDFPTALVFL